MYAAQQIERVLELVEIEEPVEEQTPDYESINRIMTMVQPKVRRLIPCIACGDEKCPYSTWSD